MKYYYLTDAEINNLRSGLMSKKNRKNKSYPSSKTKSNKSNLSKSFSSFYKQTKKTQKGHHFEENIKNILKIEYGWTDVIKDTHFFYRTIQIASKKILLKLGCSKTLIINGRRYKFLLYPNQCLRIIAGYISRRFITNITEKNKETKINLNNANIIVSKVNEIEIDVFMKLTSNAIEKIAKDNDDIICLYKNIDDDREKNAEYACCEVKLNIEQINKLLKQLEKDKNILENTIGYKNIIYIGFVGNDKKSNKISNNLLIKLKNIKGLDLLILQIKKYSWLKRKLTQNIDWEAYSLYKSLKNENILLKNENAFLKEKVDTLKEQVTTIGNENAFLKEQVATIGNENTLLKERVDNLFEIVKKTLESERGELTGKSRRRK